MTKTPYTLTTATTTTVFSRKDRAVAAGEATGEGFTVTNPKGVLVHEYDEDSVEAFECDECEDTGLQGEGTGEEKDCEGCTEATEVDEDVEVDTLTAAAIAAGKATKVVGASIIGLPTVARTKVCKKGDDHEFRTTASGQYCYTCDRVAAEAQRAARAAAKAAK